MSELDDIKATYRRYAERERGRLWEPRNPGYARLVADRDRAVVELIDASLPKQGGAILDIGCGTGHGAALAEEARAKSTYTGIDLLEDRIAIARAASATGNFVVGSADAMPFANSSFDVVLAMTVFSSLPSWDLQTRVAVEVSRVLRPGGWLVWYDLRLNNPANRSVHGVSRRDLAALFPSWAAELRSLSVAPPVARRLGRLTAVAYPVLDSIPSMRSHLVGRLQCPF